MSRENSSADIGHHPIERRGNHARKRYLGRGNLPHELVGSPGKPRIEERAEVVLQFGIGGHDGENLLVGLVQELDRMGEGATAWGKVQYLPSL